MILNDIEHLKIDKSVLFLTLKIQDFVKNIIIMIAHAAEIR